jgi:hypothetical protein
MIVAVPDASFGCIINPLCLGTSVGGDIAHQAASSVLDVVASAMGSAASWLVGHVIDLINGTTSVQLGSAWFTERTQAMRNVLVLVVLPVLIAATIGAILRQDLRRLGRVWAVGLPVSLMAGIAGVQFANLALAATDQMCQIVAGGGASRQMADAFSGVMVSSLTSAEPPIVQIAIAGLIIIGTVLVWLELVVRAAAVYVAVFFMPLALVGYIWPATTHMARRVLELFMALVLSKFVIVATLTLGLAAVTRGSTPDGAVAGGAILLIAGFAPFVILRLTPMVETAAISHLEGLSRRPLHASASVATAAAAAPAHPVGRLLLAGAARRESAAPPGPTAVAAQPVAFRRADFPTGASDDG